MKNIPLQCVSLMHQLTLFMLLHEQRESILVFLHFNNESFREINNKIYSFAVCVSYVATHIT